MNRTNHTMVLSVLLCAAGWCDAAQPEQEVPHFIQATIIGDGTPFGVATTRDDGFVTVGAFGGSATFGTSNLTAAAGLDVFVARYDASGTLLWVRTAGGNDPVPNPPWTQAHEANAVALDANENVFVAGYIESPATFGTTNVIGSAGSAGTAGSSLFLAKYDASGKLLWVRSSEPPAAGQPAGAFQASDSLAVDTTGNAYVSGPFRGNLKLGATTLTAGADGSLFVAKYSPSGAVMWARAFGTTFNERYSRIAQEKGRGTVLLAYQSSGMGMVLRRLDGLGGGDSVLGGLSASGGIRPFALGVSNDGEVYCAGDFAGLLSSGQQSADESGDVFIAKWSSSGALQWVRTGGGPNDDYAYSVLVDQVGESYLCGVFSGRVQFGWTQLTSSGQRDSFIVKHGRSGDVLWATSLGGTWFDDIASAALSSSGDLLAVGSFNDTAAFGELLLTAASPRLFAARLAALPRLFIERRGNSARVVWHTASTNFVLEGTSATQSPLVWEPLSQAVNRAGKTNWTALTLDGQGKSIRLRRAVP